MSLPARALTIAVRDLLPSDLEDVIRIDAAHSGKEQPEYWSSLLRDFLRTGEGGPRVGLAAECEGRLVGHLLGEVSAFEFGSEPCGWIFAVGVDPLRLREGVGSRLLEAACRRFRALGVARVRTMVRRDAIPVLSFFRAAGLEGGPFVQLELDLTPDPGRTRP